MKLSVLVLLLALMAALPACKKKPNLAFWRPFLPTSPATPAPACLSKGIKQLNYQELQQAKTYYASINKKELQIKVIERMIALSNNLLEIKQLRLELADLYFDYGSIDKAGVHYSEYVRLFPSCTHREYAEYKAILCRFYALLTCDRDQTKTHETLTLAQAYFDNHPQHAQYQDEIKRIEQACTKKLFDHEAGVVDFYMRQKSYKSAQQRIAYIKDTFINSVITVEPEVLAMEYALAQKTNNTELSSVIKSDFQTRFAEHELAAIFDEQKQRDDVARF